MVPDMPRALALPSTSALKCPYPGPSTRKDGTTSHVRHSQARQMLANHGRCLAVKNTGFVAWLRPFVSKENARGDLARIAAEDEWSDGGNFVDYWQLIPRTYEDALKSAWLAYADAAQRQGQAKATPRVSKFCFTSADLRGKPRRCVAGYILRKIEASAPACWEVPPADGDPENWGACVRWRQKLWAAVFDLVASCVERGYRDEEIVYLANHMAATKALWPHLPIRRYRQIRWLIQRQRKLHPHPGRTCTTAGCRNAPEWMVSYAQTG